MNFKKNRLVILVSVGVVYAIVALAILLSHFDRAMNQQAQLKRAISENNLKEAENLLRNGVDPNPPWEPSPSLLYVAVRRGDKQAADLLLKYGIDVHSRASTSALQEAVRLKDLQMIELLLESGVNPVQVGSGGDTPLQTALESDNKSILKIFERHRRRRP